MFLKLDYKKTFNNVNVCNHIEDSVYYNSWEVLFFKFVLKGRRFREEI